MRLRLFNTTAFRLSVGYTLLVTLAVGVTLGSAYLLTESLITDEVDLIIDTELQSLQDKYARSGVAGVTDEINLRIDSWGRIGAVYMLADSTFERIAGNVTNWPFDGMPAEHWPEFEIATIEPGRRAVHPVRAAVRTLPGGDLLLAAPAQNAVVVAPASWFDGTTLTPLTELPKVTEVVVSGVPLPGVAVMSSASPATL